MFSRWFFLLVKIHRASWRTGPDSDWLTVIIKRQIPVFGQGDMSWDTLTSGGTEHFRSSTKCLTATRMKAPWLTTSVCIETPCRPSFTQELQSEEAAAATPWSVTPSDNPGDASDPDEPCSSNICLKRILRNFLNRSFTWNKVTSSRAERSNYFCWE